MDWNKLLYQMLCRLRNQLEGAQPQQFSAQAFDIDDAVFLNAVCLLADSGYIVGVNYVYNNGQRFVQSIVPRITMSGMQYIAQYEQQRQSQRDTQALQEDVEKISKKPSGCRVAVGLSVAAIGAYMLWMSTCSAWHNGLS